MTHIKKIYKSIGIYISISIQESIEKTALAKNVDGNTFDGNNIIRYCIEMVNPKGIILKCEHEKMKLEELYHIIDEMVCSYENTRTNEMGMIYYKYISAVPVIHDMVKNGEKFLLDEEELNAVLKSINHLMREKVKLSNVRYSTYCLQFFESTLFLNSSGSFIYTQDNHFSIRTSICNDFITQQLSMYGNKIDKKCISILIDRLQMKYQYKIDVIRYGKVKNSEQSLSKYRYIIFDFDLFGTILHESIGHAFESNGKKNDMLYKIGEQLPCLNVDITDSGLISDWVKVKYDSYGNRRYGICLIENGIVKNHLYGIFGALMGKKWNYCDRKSKSGDIPQSRMTTIDMSINRACYTKKYYQSLLTLMKDMSNMSDVLFLIGSRSGEYNIQNNRVTVFPEFACSISNGNITYWNVKKISFNAKDAISNIISGYGKKCERYNFCEKNGQTVPTSSILNQFVLTNNFLKNYSDSEKFSLTI